MKGSGDCEGKAALMFVFSRAINARSYHNDMHPRSHWYLTGLGRADADGRKCQRGVPYQHLTNFGIKRIVSDSRSSYRLLEAA
jgi:hypothetical protein